MSDPPRPEKADSSTDKPPADDTEAAADKVVITVDKDAKEAIPPVSFLSLFRFSTRLEITLDIIGVVAALAAGAAQPLLSLLFGRLINSFVRFGLTSAIYKTGNATPEQVQQFHDAQHAFRRDAAADAGYLALIGIGAFFTTWLYMIIWTWTGELNARRIRERYFGSILKQEVAYFDSIGAGEVTTRIQTDTHLIQQGMSEKVPMTASFIGAFFTGYILAYVQSWRLALALTSVLPAITISGGIMQTMMKSSTKASLEHVAEAGTLAEEIFSSIRTTKAFGTQRRLAAVYDTHISKALTADLQNALATGLGMGAFFFIVYASYGLAFNFGTTLILQGHGDVGTMINVFMSILIGSFSLALMAPEMQAINTALGAAAKIFATIERVPVIDSSSSEGKKLSSVTGAVALENVSFHYPSRPDIPVLKSISLSFAPGTTSALVGASGSGKSTIVALIERFYDPDPASGRVELDGVDVRDLNVRWLRSQIGLVSQEPVLFGTSIKNNVAYGLVGTEWEDVSEAEKARLVKAACIKANAHTFIQKLPQGYDTNVGERGFLLSGGQKQRIAIARAIVGNPAILLLDEATSALDTQSEGVVQDALNKASEGRTTITVAHRLSTIKNANRIFVIGEGRLIESGSHDELLQDPQSAYARLVSAQALREQQEQESLGTDNDLVPAKSPLDATLKAGVETLTVDGKSDTWIPLDDVPSVSGLVAKSEAPRERAYPVSYIARRLAKINKDCGGIYATGALAALVSGAGYPVVSIVYGKAIQNYQSTDRHQLRHNGDRDALWFFLIAIVLGVSMSTQSWAFQKGSSIMAYKLRTLSFKSTIKQDVSWFDEERHSTGALVSGLADSPQKVMGMAGVTLGAVTQSLATLIGGWIVGFVYGWKLAFVGLCMVPLLGSAGFIRLLVVEKKDEHNKKSHEASAKIACEGAGAIRTIASLKREQGCLQEYSESLELPLRRSIHSAMWGGALFGFTQSVTFFGLALMFWYGSRLVADLTYTTQQFFICNEGILYGALQAGTALSFIPDLSNAKIAASAIFRVVDSKPVIDADSPDGTTVTQTQGRLELNDIHFRYPTRPDAKVLNGVDITVEPGTYVAIVGASGSGKSTLVQLVERFYDPESGHIILDGQDIRTLNLQDYRQQLSLVSQEPTLYIGTLRFNILLGATRSAEDVTQEEIEKACRDANILDFIQSLPEGFETQVGGKGSQLSGGQKQRIAIARALIRNPRVLLLDEATSALDSESESVVQQALDNASKGRTTIAIAHRLSTIQNADRIYYIKEGVVAESGTHDELLRLKGGYYELVQLQALSKKD